LFFVKIGVAIRIDKKANDPEKCDGAKRYGTFMA